MSSYYGSEILPTHLILNRGSPAADADQASPGSSGIMAQAVRFGIEHERAAQGIADAPSPMRRVARCADFRALARP
eukprot:CAMPEP_0176124968 /NCGR_PEP_ID=MMETSP0120_2-20121206/63028_1 /TAXON_ID=160619 /ORGANISM="Kryptoperidinium foliaceum, Strain CCMP 1326" /LENGTH=75 /DNA_ID=CAMNT_0017459789 /DNA_START=1 /DNA_END=228 /DNA_ORIENTATION=-